MKKIKKYISIILAMALSSGLCACSGENNEIKSLTNHFENSCNDLDLNEMLDCIDPEISGGIKKITGLIGMFSDKDTDEILDKIAGVLFNNLPGNSVEFFSSIKIELDNIEIDENNAYASAEITYEISGEENIADANFEYIYTDDQWYISNLDIE